MSHSTPPLDGIHVGPDLTCVEGDALVIYAVTPMDWPVREFFRVPIFVRGWKYYLRQKSKAKPPFAMRYELCRWPDDSHDESNLPVTYDELYVRQRDLDALAERRANRAYFFLVPFSPLLGLCWSGFKERVLGPLGFAPSTITKGSVALTFFLWIGEGIFVGWLRGGMLLAVFSAPRLQVADWVLFVLLGLDSAIRFSGLLRSETDYHLGFCEWLKPRRR
jgi:hypothetical protein